MPSSFLRRPSRLESLALTGLLLASTSILAGDYYRSHYRTQIQVPPEQGRVYTLKDDEHYRTTASFDYEPIFDIAVYSSLILGFFPLLRKEILRRHQKDEVC